MPYGIGVSELIILWIILGFVVGVPTALDVAKHEHPGTPERMLWIMVTLFGGVIGSLAYWIGRRPRRKASRRE